MEYSLLTIVDDKDLAIRISDYLKSNDVDSYTKSYSFGHWCVWVDKSKVAIAQDLFCSHDKQYTNYRPNWTWGNGKAQGNAQSNTDKAYSFPAHSLKDSIKSSSHRWGYYLLAALVVVCISFYYTTKDDKTKNNIDKVNYDGSSPTKQINVSTVGPMIQPSVKPVILPKLEPIVLPKIEPIDPTIIKPIVPPKLDPIVLPKLDSIVLPNTEPMILPNMGLMAPPLNTSVTQN